MTEMISSIEKTSTTNTIQGCQFEPFEVIVLSDEQPSQAEILVENRQDSKEGKVIPANQSITLDHNGNKEVVIEMDPSRSLANFNWKMSAFKIFILKSVRVLFNILSFLWGLLSPSVRGALPPIEDPLLLASAAELTQQIKAGKLKSQTLVQAYIKRIQQVQPYLNTMVDERFTQALEEARIIDETIELEMKKGIPPDSPESIRRKLLLGLPLTTKNSLGVKGMIFDTGSYPRRGTRAEEDAEAIQRAREAGAILVCITNTPELVLWMDSHNVVYGRTNNPYDLGRIPGGSSGGEGALISSAGSLMGVGSDVGGSIRIPAFYCGVFGHATTPGVVPVTGMYPTPCESWAAHLSFGPICRYASDMRLLLKVLAGPKGNQLLRLDEKVSLNNLTIYYLEDIGNPLSNPVQPEIKEAMEKTLEHFRVKFNARIEKLTYGRAALSIAMWIVQLSSGDAYPMAEEAACRQGRINPFWELIKFLVTLSKHTLPVIILSLGQSIGPKKGSVIHEKLLDKAKRMRQYFLKLLGQNGVILCPTLPVPALKHRTTLVNSCDTAYTMLTNAMSFPATHCPTGLNKNGLPIGFQIVTPPYRDNLGITMACEVEKIFGGWTPPSKVNC